MKTYTQKESSKNTISKMRNSKNEVSHKNCRRLKIRYREWGKQVYSR